MGFFRKLWDAHVQHYYPLSVTQLTNFEWYLLIWVLSIDETPSTSAKSKSNPKPMSDSRDDRIRRAIRLLPEDLRRHRTLESTISKDRDRAILLCTAHIGFNPFLIGQIMMMLYEEVTDHLFELDWYIRTAHPDAKGYSSGVEDIVAELQKVKDTWWPEQLWPPPPPSPNGAQAEIVLCDACVLGKVVAAPTFLENLRTALLARHGHRKERAKKYPKEERKSPRPPVLLSFVDESIFTYDNAAKMVERSNTLADEMLSARLEARKAWKEWERQQDSLGLPTGRPKRPCKKHVQQQQKQDPQQRRAEHKESTRKLTKPAGKTSVEEPPVEESPVEEPQGRAMRKVDSPWTHLTPISQPTPSLDKDSIMEEIDGLYASWKARPSLPCSSIYSRDDVFPDIPPTAPLSIRKEPSSMRRKPLPPGSDVSTILSGRSLSPRSAPQSHQQHPYLRRKPLPPDSDVVSIRSEQSTVPSYTASLRGRDKGKARMSVASEVNGANGDYVPPREGVSWRRVVYGRPASIGPSKAQTIEYTTTVRSDAESEPEREDALAREPGPNDTTWSLLLKSGM